MPQNGLDKEGKRKDGVEGGVIKVKKKDRTLRKKLLLQEPEETPDEKAERERESTYILFDLLYI